MNEEDVETGRFSQRFAFYDEPRVFEQLERVAAEHRRSMSAEIRSAIRLRLEQEQPRA